MTGEGGLELAYNSLLQGRGGRVVYEQGTNGLPIPGTESTVKEAVPAGNLRLTIQSDIQWKAEQECARQVARTNARNCTVVVMQPGTGRILALAQYPTFNPVGARQRVGDQGHRGSEHLRPRQHRQGDHGGRGISERA